MATRRDFLRGVTGAGLAIAAVRPDGKRIVEIPRREILKESDNTWMEYAIEDDVSVINREADVGNIRVKVDQLEIVKDGFNFSVFKVDGVDRRSVRAFTLSWHVDNSQVCVLTTEELLFKNAKSFKNDPPFGKIF